jgi:hypothetical protein
MGPIIDALQDRVAMWILQWPRETMASAAPTLQTTREPCRNEPCRNEGDQEARLDEPARETD